MVKFGTYTNFTKLKFDTSTYSNMQNSMVVFLFFCFRAKIPLLGKFLPNSQNCQFKLKIGSQSNSNMQNSVGGAVYLFFYQLGMLFLGKFGTKTQNCQFILKFSFQTTSNMQNSMVLFTFSVFDQKYSFWVNLVKKINFTYSMQ